jgi:hypothetical protein
MSRRRAHRSRASAALLVGVAGLLTAAAPAGAYLRDFTVKQQTSAFNNNSPKRELVPVTGCPGPIIGGAAFVSPGLPNLGLLRLQPFGGLLTGATETDSETPSWRLFSRAFCVGNTGVAPNVSGNPASYLKDLSYVTQLSSNNSSTTKSVVAKCPGGSTAIGGGGRLLAASSNVAFNAMQRVQGNTAWRVGAREVDSTNVNWQVLATAICADITSPTGVYLGDGVAPNYGFTQQVNPSTGYTSTSPKVVMRTCAVGYRVIGGGAWVLGFGFDSPVSPKVVVTRSSLGVNARTWIAEARETDDTPAEWRLNASVACAKG